MTSRAFDELYAVSDQNVPREALAALATWLQDTPVAELERRQKAAELAFRQLGVTFAVYGEEAAAERIIPFDIVPRIFTAGEWQHLQAGLTQRVQAINAFLCDIYSAQRILEDGVIPKDIILTNPQFRKELIGVCPPHDVWAHIAGIDLVRTSADDFWVLEEQCPHALGRIVYARKS